MTDEAGRWERVKQVFQDALDRTPGERSAFLREACRDDRELRAEVDSLLLAHEAAGSFAHRPAIDALSRSAAVAIDEPARVDHPDVDEHPRLDEARVQAHDNDIRVAISNPCFELWLVLHFRSQNAYLTCQAAKDLAGSLLTGYDKELTAAMFELPQFG
jgi:hypothetical protein